VQLLSFAAGHAFFSVELMGSRRSSIHSRATWQKRHGQSQYHHGSFARTLEFRTLKWHDELVVGDQFSRDLMKFTCDVSVLHIQVGDGHGHGLVLFCFIVDSSSGGQRIDSSRVMLGYIAHRRERCCSMPRHQSETRRTLVIAMGREAS